MARDLFLGIDHGGTTTTALLLDPDRGKVATASVPMQKRCLPGGLVEHDADDFVATSLAASAQALAAVGATWNDVAAIGIANQGETSMAWSARTGRPMGPAISWEDRRTVGMCEALAGDGVDLLVRERTGLLLDPYFSASKFAWLLANAPGAEEASRSGDIRLGGTDAYTLFHLTGGESHVTETATASRSALLNLRSADWDDDLLAAFGVPRAALPSLRPTTGGLGELRHPGIPARGVEVTANAVDAHAALFAHGCWDSSTAKITYGTGAFIEVNTGSEPVEPDGRLLVLIGWEVEGARDHLLEGGVFSVGSAIDWAVAMGWLPSAAASSDLAETVGPAGALCFVPCLAGLAAPHWRPQARGRLDGLGLDTTPAGLARALLDGIAFQCADVVRALEARMGGTLSGVRADGGPTRNRYLMQRQADLLGIPLEVSDEPDMTALGAAALAAIGAGRMKREGVLAFRPPVRTFEPRMAEDERAVAWEGWQRAISQLRDRTADERA